MVRLAAHLWAAGLWAAGLWVVVKAAGEDKLLFHTYFTLFVYTSTVINLLYKKGFIMKKTTLAALGAAALLTSTSLFAEQDSIQEHLKMEQKIQKQEQQRLKDGSGSGTKSQYKHQNQYQNQHQYNGSSATRPSTGPVSGQGGGKR